MKRLLILLLTLFALAARASEPLMVAAASDLGYCIDELNTAFRGLNPGAEIKVSLGASGNFFAQIKHGAPFDVFLSADMSYPALLAKEGAAEQASLAPYAVGRVALWTIDPRFNLQEGLRVLADPRLTRLAIANPDVAPYGRAAKAALEAHGYWDAVKAKLVLGENIAQTAQFVQTGNAQMGIISFATVMSPRLKGVGRYYLIPDTGVAPIEQGMVVTSHGRAHPLAARYLQFMQTAGAREILLRHGFGLPRTANHG
jgi:molybdate transport system substrate-binding protein